MATFTKDQEHDMNDGILETKTFRRKEYTLERRKETFCVVTYNSIGVPEVLDCFNNLNEAKCFFDEVPQIFKKLKVISKKNEEPKVIE